MLNLTALADYLLEIIDCSDEYEEDEFGIEFQGQRMFVQRYPSFFRIEHANKVMELPRP